MQMQFSEFFAAGLEAHQAPDLLQHSGGSIELSGPQQRWSACYTVGKEKNLVRSNMLYLLNATIFPFCLSIATLQ